MSPTDCPPRSEQAGSPVACPQDGPIRRIEQDIHDIKIALLGDSHLGVDGLVHGFKVNRERIESLEGTRNVAMTIASGAGAVLGVLATWIASMIPALFHKG